MESGLGVNTVIVNDKPVHITELDELELCKQWTSRQKELSRLYEINHFASRGFKGFVLKLLGINLPQKRGVFKLCSSAEGQHNE